MPNKTIADKTILIIDKHNGKLINVNSWGDHLFIMPHGLAELVLTKALLRDITTWPLTEIKIFTWPIF
jgi:hypothetical protein